MEQVLDLMATGNTPAAPKSNVQVLAVCSCHGSYVIEVEKGDNFDEGVRRGTLLMLAVSVVAFLVLAALGL